MEIVNDNGNEDLNKVENKKKKVSTRIIEAILTLLIIAVLYYLLLPPINLHSKDFVTFLALSIVIILVVNFMGDLRNLFVMLATGTSHMERDPMTGQVRRVPNEEPAEPLHVSRPVLIGVGVLLALIILYLIANVIGSEIFNAKRYRDLVSMETGDFATDVAEISMNSIPVVDKDTATRLGSRKLGEMTELVSQFEISDNYTQINYQGTPYRVTPLKYADPFKWFYNFQQGLPAYITVNMVTQEAELVWLDEGMKYSPSEYFFRNIYRHVRFNYPTKIIGTASFEIDDDGTPYWVIPTITYRIGWWSGRDITGCILVNAINGDCTYYDKVDVPQWIDQLFDSNLIIQQLDYNGIYQNGWINSMFGQRDVRKTTSGYNYLAMNDDVYLYTGMSSVTGDQSNIGFVLVNLRTKETKFYQIPGATESSAMASAEGQVQHLKYTATFPLLLNVSDRPTYFVSLKDDAGLVKMYAFVDVEQYQIVGTGQTIDAARRDYRNALNLEDVELAEPLETDSTSGTVDQAMFMVVDGETCCYFTLKGDEDSIYSVYVTTDPKVAFMKSGDKVEITFSNDDEPLDVTEIEFK